MKEITTYKTEDGKIFEFKEEALLWEASFSDGVIINFMERLCEYKNRLDSTSWEKEMSELDNFIFFLPDIITELRLAYIDFLKTKEKE